MFFHEKIRSIKHGDRVLEVGPGATPHPRANVFLEYQFNDDAEKIRQRGDLKSLPDYRGREVIYYTGDKFPFRDDEFDYVIASHVVEHVPNPKVFMKEVYRVGKGRGYVEFPLPSYDYLFDFNVHQQFVWFDEKNKAIHYLKKEKTNIQQFMPITSQLRRGLEMGWDQLISQNPDYFFTGIEFNYPIPVYEQENLSNYSFVWQRSGNRFSQRLTRKITQALSFFD